MNFIIAVLIFVLSSCSNNQAVKEPSKIDMSQYLSSDGLGFKKAEEIKQFEFPKDHSAHPDFKTEWWYFTGNLDSSKNHYGYQLTIFRNGIFDQKTGSYRNIYMGHLGLSDIKNDKFYSHEIFQREDMELAGVKNQHIWLNDWTIDFEQDKIYISSFQNQLGFELELEAKKPIILQGDRGLSKKNAIKGNASYYYSIPRLKTTGTVQIADKSYTVTGESWLDREWSTSSLSDKQEGWDWFALQLDNQSELMLYQLRNKDGSIDEFSSGSFIDAQGRKFKLRREDIKIEVLENWQSYPSKWSIKIPKYKLDLEVVPYIKDQLHRFKISYWEGAVKVKGSHKGQGYAELTGY